MPKISKETKAPKPVDSHKIFVSLFGSVRENTPAMARESSWLDWRSFICDETKRKITAQKTSAQLFSCARFNGKRGNDNVEIVTAAVLDFDSGISFASLLQSATAIEFAAYSTYNHTPEKQKFRIVAPLSRPVTAAEYSVLWGKVNDLFGGGADQSAKDPSRISYLPSCPKENKGHAFSHYNKGKFLNPDKLLSGVNIPTNAPNAGERPDMTQGYPDTQRTHEMTRRIGWCLGVNDMTEDEAIEACLEWNTHNMPPLPDEKIVNAVKSIAKGNAAKLRSEPWGELTPLVTKAQAFPYPIDALPEKIRDAVKEVQKFVQAPVAMIASSALATISIAAQAYADVQRSEKLHGPIGLYFLTIAESGERKTTCDQCFMSAIRKYEKEQREKGAEEQAVYQAKKKIWDVQESTLRGIVKDTVVGGKDVSRVTEKLVELQRNEPREPKIPRLIFTDTTPEALVYSLAKKWAAGGIVSSEAGLVFGGHGMKGESIMLNLSVLNMLWDGTPYQSDRKSAESFMLDNARLTIALQIQAPMLQAFFDRAHGLPRGGGFMARFLIANPESTQGTRKFSEPSSSCPCLAVFHSCIEAILKKPPRIIGNSLQPVMLQLSSEAKAAWVQFHDEVELKLCVGGQLHDVRDVASKVTDNAARLAALFHLFEGRGENSKISHAHMEAARSIVSWHLHEAQRFFGEIALPEELANAGRLERWLIGHCQREGVITIAQRHAQQFSPVRVKEALQNALSVLEDLGHVRVVKQGKRRDIHFHPDLINPPA